MEQSVRPDPNQESNIFSRRTRGRDMLALSRPANVFLNILMIVACILALFPIYVIVIASVTSEASLTANGYRLWPEEF